MKTLILVRHAESGWSHPLQNDSERILKNKGKRDATEMAFRLSQKNILPDRFISSTAERAIETAEYFLTEFKKDKKELQLASHLYQPHIYSFYRTVESIDNFFQCAILFSHNPGITEFINDLGCKPVPGMPACGMYGIRLITDDWAELRSCKKEFLFFDFPDSKED